MSSPVKYVGSPNAKPTPVILTAMWILEQLQELVSSAASKDKDGSLHSTLELLGLVNLLTFIVMGEDALTIFDQWVRHKQDTHDELLTPWSDMMIASLYRCAELHKSAINERSFDRWMMAMNAINSKRKDNIVALRDIVSKSTYMTLNGRFNTQH